MPVPTRTEQLDDLYTTTFNNRWRAGLIDQIFDASPVTQELLKGKGMTFDGTGGRYLEVDLAYAKNETVKSIGKGDTVSLSDTKFMTVAQFEWKFVAGNVTRYFVDDAKNKSVQQHIAWANKKVDNLRDSMIDEIERQLISGDGTGNGSLDIDAFGNIIDITPDTARTVGNIAQTTYTWWKNRQKTSTGAASVYLLSDMRNLANTCSEGKTRDYPNMLVTTQAVAELYDDEVLEQKQIVNQSEGDAEFMKTRWKGIPIIWSARVTSGRMYFLNRNYCGFVTDPDINFMMTAWKPIPNQVEDRVLQVVTKFNFVASRRKSLGVLTAVA